MKKINWKKIVFYKVELWVLAMALTVFFLINILLNNIAILKERGSDKFGIVGELSHTTSTILIDTYHTIFPKLPSDFINRGIDRSFAESEYKEFILSKEQNVSARYKNNSETYTPVALSFRTNTDGNESLFIFDQKRELVDRIDLRVKSKSGKYKSRIGITTRMLDDGGMISFPNGGDGLYRLDSCGKIIWAIDGLFHHHFSIENGKIGILGLPSSQITHHDYSNWNHSDIINIIDIETGRIERSVSIKDIAMKNTVAKDPMFIDTWISHVNDRGVLTKDLIHLNKLELLSDELSKDYPSLPKNAWLISARNLNLTFIVDPITLDIVWYSHGWTQKQHDPHFVGQNKIWIFDNRQKGNHTDQKHPSNYSNVTQYDFSTGQWSRVFSGEKINGFTAYSGCFDIDEQKNMMLNYTLQGRYTEISRNGDVISEYINQVGENNTYWTKCPQYLSKEQIELIKNRRCK